MSISIDRNRCTGCGACNRVCPGNLLALDAEGRAKSRSPRDCWGCTACLKACRFGAIAYFLGADMGGRGTTLSVASTETEHAWTFTRADGGTRTIVIDRRTANNY
ncbi:MAG: ferredoxin family protein [Eggerthellaceae bacterium]|nr:ferredoxin family protein [Eggerthellaceae bacterium]